MNDLILNTAPTMSSLEIARLTGKEHAHVMRDIRNMLIELNGDTSGLSKFGSTYTNSQNKELPCFDLPKEETICLMAGYDIKARMLIIKRWQELEKSNTVKLPDFNNPVESARAWADAKEAEQKALAQLENARPAVEFVERYVEAEGSKGLREVCKLLEANEARFKEFLISNKIMYRLSGRLMPFACHIDAGRFEVKAGIAENEHAFTQAKFTPKGIAWVAGLWMAEKIK